MNKAKEIKLFSGVTTEEVLKGLEVEAKEYEGLYVDMDNKPERKYVKDKAALISGMLKTLDRARIDESKNYKTLVEAEAASIKERLEEANKPFTLLIDEHKEKRAKELAKIKEIEDRKALAEQKEADHESAIMEDKVRTFEKAEAEKEAANQLEAQRLEVERMAKAQAEQEAQAAIDLAESNRIEAIRREEQAVKQAEEAERLRIEAVEQQKIAAKLAEERRIEAVEQQKIAAKLAEERRIEAEKLAIQGAAQAAENARLAEIERQKQEDAAALVEQKKREANKKHKGLINRGIVDVLVSNGISEEDAKTVVTLAAKMKLPNLTINY